jgi:hypothetical protein
MSELHAFVGGLVLAVNLLAGLGLALTRRSTVGRRWFQYLAVVGFALLLAQLALGGDLWMRGRRPALSPLAEIHVAGPVLSSLLYLLALIRTRRTQSGAALSAATLSAAAVALISYGIGEIG